MLSTLSAYLRERRRASLVDMAHALHAEPEAVRGMLQVLVRKGRVHALPAGTGCGHSSCGKCAPDAVEMFEWLDAGAANAAGGGGGGGVRARVIALARA